MSTRPLFPIFLKLADQRCLVVGGTAVLESKIRGLFVSGARVRVVAADVTDPTKALAAEGHIEWMRRPFEPSDLDEVILVVAADQDQSINELVYLESKARNITCNVVDQPERCRFYYPAVVQRGQLQIAISTGGLSPSLASSIRAELEERFGSEYVEWVNALGEARRRILATRASSEKRTSLLKRIASRGALEQFRRRRKQGRKGAI